MNQKRVIILRNTWCVHFCCVYRMVHGLTCVGILPSQYTHLSMFSGIGTIGHSYIRRGVLL